MQFPIYVLLFLATISSILAAPIRQPHLLEVQTSSSPSPTPTPTAIPQNAVPLRTTGFIEKEAGTPFKAQIGKVVLKSRRKVEAFCRSVHERLIPEVKAPKEDIFLLRALEDPIFASAQQTLALTSTNLREL